MSTATVAAIVLTVLGLVAAPAVLATSTSSMVASGRVVEYRLPFLAGQRYAVTQGWNGSFSHTGHSAYAYDFALPMRTPVVAAAAGVVAFAETGHRGCGDESLRGAANSVTIYHADGTATLYAHLSRVSVHVGQRVIGGQVVGLSGKTGFTDCEPHLHFARQAQGRRVTQSLPIYFVETGHRRIHAGTVVTSDNPICSQSTAGLPDGGFCATYVTAGKLGPLKAVRLEATVDLGSPPVPVTASPARRPSPARATPATALSATWVGRFTFAEADIYTFTLQADRDASLSIDGTVVIDATDDPLVSGDRVLVRWLASGQHVIRVDYRSTGAPYVHLDWRQTGPGAILPTDY